ncbi:polysaccharide deacetylase family protein [Paenibacillus contaminans]|uniref:Polysaccharide deacetylase n=1 Tax=Paenibacillus contaminans TaxID=450362 RepID=A0A329MGI9_9BACL|nr:polysaccharide deacetylase family protein [Paenibacillus contaminans]RAV19061.1 polysaccharide deacetylase [Paenibacillus contaminans]
MNRHSKIPCRLWICMGFLFILMLLLAGCGGRRNGLTTSDAPSPVPSGTIWDRIEAAEQEAAGPKMILGPIKQRVNDQYKVYDPFRSLREKNDERNIAAQKAEKAPKSQPQREEGGKMAYLTFDDGPSIHTRKILDILRQNGVKATFFVIGSRSEESIRSYRAIVADGHALGNHTYTHDYRTVYSSVEAYKKDTERLNDLLEETVGFRPKLIRFPGGSNNRLSHKSGGGGIMKRIAAEMTRNGYRYVDWNVSSTDAALPVQKRAEIVKAVLQGSGGKREIIVLMHDIAKKTTTVEALSEIIAGLRAQGYQFGVLDRTSFTFHFQL